MHSMDYLILVLPKKCRYFYNLKFNFFFLEHVGKYTSSLFEGGREGESVFCSSVLEGIKEPRCRGQLKYRSGTRTR